MTVDFCNLHVHDEYSQLDGLGSAELYARRARELDFKYLALTNHGNIDGLIKFQKSCEDNDIAPIFGCEAYIVPDDFIKEGNKDRRRGHVVLLVKNEVGFSNLCHLLSFANKEGKYYKPRITFTELLEHSEGLVVSTACVLSFVNVFKRGEEFFYDLYDILRGDLYCEIMPHDMRKQYKTNERIIRLANKVGAKIIATNDCHYILKEDREVHKILINIQTNKDRKDDKGWSFPAGDYHLISQREMRQSLKKMGFYRREYLSNTLEVAEKCCTFRIAKRDVTLPRVRLRGYSLMEDSALWRLCLRGFRDRFKYNIEDNPEYFERLKEEFEVIKKKKFCRYFLIVWELVRWCKSNYIFVGPGRGSVGGSLIAYLLRITIVDPIRFNLIFSRFISLDRIDYPDIDIDFEAEKKSLVRKHLETMYGSNNIAGVTTFSRMKARSVVKDVARSFGIPFKEVNDFTKMVESQDDSTGIQEAIEIYPECADFAYKYPKVIEYSSKLEGQIRGYNLHAAALVLDKNNIYDGGRCNIRMEKSQPIINWGKEDAEYMGFLKLDALGLKQLGVFGETLRLIKKNRGITVDLGGIDLEDKHVIAELNKGNTQGVFQYNTYSGTRLLTRMDCTNFNHLVAATALVRPGPAYSGMTDEYIRRMKGGGWERKHPIYEEITAETYGVIVFQEQVMEVIYRVAGLHYSTADKIRKIIGKKKDKTEFEQYRIEFMEGCKQTGYFIEEEAEEFWEGLQEHAKYSFNKSHSVEYAIVGYWCAWLKYYYPTEFICGSLTYGADIKKDILVREAYRLGLKLMLPKVGISNPMIWEANGNTLCVPFIEIEGLGERSALDASQSPAAKYTGKGFDKMFNRKNRGIVKHEGELGKKLDRIKAYDPLHNDIDDLPLDVSDLFSFPLAGAPEKQYKNLYEMLGDIRPDHLEDILHANFDNFNVRGVLTPSRLRDSKFKGFEDLLRCNRCSLIEECSAPVPPSAGEYNIMIIGQDPGYNEDKKGIGFIGKAGKKLWSSLGSRFPREFFHVTNAAKCFPSASRKSNEMQVKTCCNYFLRREIEEVRPILILALGANAMGVFNGQWKGITKYSGQVEWNDQYRAWVVYCIHPAAVLHNDSNLPAYNDGIKRFKGLLKLLGL